MSRIMAITSRELRSYFLSPGGYVIIALFLLFMSFFFMLRSFNAGQPSSLRAVFEIGTWCFLFICPAITMRAISEERRLGTFETLMTAPVSEMEVVLAKYFAALGFLACMLLPTAVYVVALELFGRPDYGELFSGYLGMLVAGAAFLASGIFASSLTASQAVAYLLTFFFWVLLILLASLLPLWDVAREHIGAGWLDSLFALNPAPRLGDFATGLIDTANVVFFLSFTIVFLIAAAKSLEVRRWA